MTEQNVMSVPTDKSMPPVMMTKVQPMASTPFTAVACRMPTMLSVCMKLGDAKLKKIISPSRLANASSFCRGARAEEGAFESLQRRVWSDLSVSRVSGCCVAWRAWGASSVRGSGGHHGFALGGQLHDLLLRGPARRQFAGDAAFAHHQDAVAQAQHLGQLARRSSRSRVPAPRARSAACRSRSWRRRRCRASARRRTGSRNPAPAIWRSRSFAGCRPRAGRPFARSRAS